MVAGLSASSLFADPVYCCAGISALDSGYTESSGTSSTGGFAGTATYKSTASGDTHTDGGRYCQGGAVADSKPSVTLVFPAVAVAGGTYTLYGTRGSDASIASDTVASITAVANCTVSAG